MSYLPNNLSKKQLLKLLAILTLTDGYVKHKRCIRLITHKKSKGQHELFAEMTKELYNKKPNMGLYFDKSHNDYFLVSQFYLRKAIKDLCKLSPTFKTTPYKESKDMYLFSKQPTISFLFSEDDTFKWLALRAWFDFDGYVCPSFRLKRKIDIKNGKKYRYHQIQFECEIVFCETNPNLTKELSSLLINLGMTPNIKKDNRNWSKIGGVIIRRINDIKKFIEHCGPITSVKISRSSNRFEGIKKARILSTLRTFLDNKRSYYFNNKLEARIYRDKLIKDFCKYVNIAP